jgi:hypothetical protein
MNPPFFDGPPDFVDNPPEVCPVCGGVKERWLNFCYDCVEAKEIAYAQCRAEGISDFMEVIARRDAALAKRRSQANPQVEQPE